MKRVLEFSHRTPRAARTGDAEAVARVRLRVEDNERGLSARQILPGFTELGQALDEFQGKPFPRLLDELDAALGQDVEPLQIAVPAEIQSWIERRAPLTWTRLNESGQLLQRDEAFVLQRADDAIEIYHRPAGAMQSTQLHCPLLELGAALAKNSLPDISKHAKRGAKHDAAVELVREVLRARWLERRLPPGLAWHPGNRSYALRRAPETFVTETTSTEQLGVSSTLALHYDGRPESFEIDVDPHDSLPLPVVRAGLRWLLRPPVEGEVEETTLFVDRKGNRPG